MGCLEEIRFIPSEMMLWVLDMLDLKNPSGKRLPWKNPLATFMSSCPLESRPSMKKATGKTDSAYAVKYRGEMKLNWGFVAMESRILWNRNSAATEKL